MSAHPRPTIRASSVARLRLVLALLLACLLGGCAYLTTYNHDFKQGKTYVDAMDVKQRVVFTQDVPIVDKDGRATNKSYTVTCAEPSPDALTVLAGSGGLSLADGTGKTANLSGALSESGAFVGLRTQSIQLLRDQLYRLCEAYASGGMNGPEFRAMQRRFQSTVLGLLAIEQLTKPVVAGQALLDSSAQSSAGAGAGDAAVTAAQDRVNTQKTTVTNAENDVATKRAAVDKDNSDISDNQTQIAAATTAKTPTDALLESKKSLQSKLDTDNLALDAAKRTLLQEQGTLKEDKADLTLAQVRVGSAASAGGQLGAVASANAQASDSLGLAVRDIVSDINASYTRDECLEMLLRRDAADLRDDRTTRSVVASTITTPPPESATSTLHEVHSEPAPRPADDLTHAERLCAHVIRLTLGEPSRRLDNQVKLAEVTLKGKQTDLDLERARLATKQFEVDHPAPAKPDDAAKGGATKGAKAAKANAGAKKQADGSAAASAAAGGKAGSGK